MLLWFFELLCFMFGHEKEHWGYIPRNISFDITRKTIDLYVDKDDELKIYNWKYEINGPGGQNKSLGDGKSLDKIVRLHKKQNRSVKFKASICYQLVFSKNFSIYFGTLGTIILNSNRAVNYQSSFPWGDRFRSSCIRKYLKAKDLIKTRRR